MIYCRLVENVVAVDHANFKDSEKYEGDGGSELDSHDLCVERDQAEPSSPVECPPSVKH